MTAPEPEPEFDLASTYISQSIQLPFDTLEEAEIFYRVFEGLGREARQRTWQHLLEVGERRGVQ